MAELQEGITAFTSQEAKKNDEKKFEKMNWNVLKRIEMNCS